MAYWQPLISPDGSPTPMFVDLLHAFFTALDPQNTGFLRPETYSEFLDVQGFLLEHNMWKNQHKPIWGGQLVDCADAEFKICLENFGFEHTVVDRNPVSPFRGPEGIGGMPLLTRRGFIDFMTLETAFWPDRGYTALNRALRYYNIWSSFVQQAGEIPRSCLPSMAPAGVKLRVERTGIMAKQRKDNMLAANAARIRMASRGRQAALDSIDSVDLGGGWVYRPGLI